MCTLDADRVIAMASTMPPLFHLLETCEIDVTIVIIQMSKL